jgi:hypothetical protein
VNYGLHVGVGGNAVSQCVVAIVVQRVVRAGPRSKIYFDPAKVRAAIVTCGRLCPGLNNVIWQVTALYAEQSIYTLYLYFINHCKSLIVLEVSNILVLIWE